MQKNLTDKALYEMQAEICKTLADPKRLMILHELRNGERSVSQLIATLGLSQANISQHLAILRERALITGRRRGRSVYYSLANPKISEACDIVREVLRDQLERNHDLANFLAPLSGRIE